MAHQPIDWRCVTTDLASVSCFLEALTSQTLPQRHREEGILSLLFLLVLALRIVCTEVRFDFEQQSIFLRLLGILGAFLLFLRSALFLFLSGDIRFILNF